MKANILMWWKKHAVHFPYLSRLARRYLAMPAITSASVERLFSVAGQVVTPQATGLGRRQRLRVSMHPCREPETADRVPGARGRPLSKTHSKPRAWPWREERGHHCSARRQRMIGCQHTLPTGIYVCVRTTHSAHTRITHMRTYSRVLQFY